MEKIKNTFFENNLIRALVKELELKDSNINLGYYDIVVGDYKNFSKEPSEQYFYDDYKLVLFFEKLTNQNIVVVCKDKNKVDDLVEYKAMLKSKGFKNIKVVTSKVGDISGDIKQQLSAVAVTAPEGFIEDIESELEAEWGPKDEPYKNPNKVTRTEDEKMADTLKNISNKVFKYIDENSLKYKIKKVNPTDEELLLDSRSGLCYTMAYDLEVEGELIHFCIHTNETIGKSPFGYDFDGKGDNIFNTKRGFEEELLSRIKHDALSESSIVKSYLKSRKQRTMKAYGFWE